MERELSKIVLCARVTVCFVNYYAFHHQSILFFMYYLIKCLVPIFVNSANMQNER